jgi:phage terminase large subunit
VETVAVAQAEFPRKLRFLFEPHRYKIVYGGRGGIKSWNFAQALIIMGADRPLRILCARETQRSLDDSVHMLLSDWVHRLHLQDFYAVHRTLESGIVGKNGTTFSYAGLTEIDSVKSTEGIDICWVEEAQRVSKNSWEKLRPTIRKPGSEIWVSFNPELDEDETYKIFVASPPPNAVVLKTTYRDNPWLPEELRIEMETLRAQDYQAYLHVWEGETTSAVAGAVYGDEMKAAQAEDRITQVSVDKLKPVHTAWDLGFFDSNALWFYQVLASGQIRIVDYLECRQKPMEWIVIQLQNRGYVYGTHWLPFDGVDALTHHQMTGDKTKSPELVLRSLGLTVRIAPKLQLSTTLLTVRAILPNCWFDAAKCADGLKSLRSYQWGVELDENGRVKGGGLEKRKPLHDWASHGASAMGTLAISLKYPTTTPVPERSYGTNRRGAAGWMGL